jgi:phenylpropionate dioxygenase-like ring-hydroxylating dioxygenase large terminal subunit
MTSTEHAVGPPTVADGWFAAGQASDVRSAPVAVRAGERRYVAFRSDPGAAIAVVAARCPHRLADLSHGVVESGRLRCPYHGWQFGPDGRCTEIPSNGPDVAVPPRADLGRPWGVREVDGVLWIAPEAPGRAAAGEAAAGEVAAGEAGAGDDRARTEILTNLDPALEQAWHPLMLAAEVPEAGASPHAARLLGRTWRVTRGPDGAPRVEPVPHAVAERFGLVWIAPRPPRVGLLDCPDDADPRFVGAWLPPERSTSPAGVLAENFLDVAHFPFVHAGTFGAAEERYVPPFDVGTTAAGLTSVQEQWFDNPEDPGVRAGLRPVRQRRRAGYTYQVPFQLWLRLEELDAGAIKTILFFLQPEDAGSTRIYTKMLLHGIGGVELPGPEVVAAEVAFEQAVLAEDLVLQQAMTVAGLPLRWRDELHVRSDRSGVALRRVLRQFTGLDPT